ncbi:hypothetical protein BHM03_00006749 [Ensete ventricosum]|uniref:Uncharacterized protein n=1 Tax=Ensete ventricosum TaxID=4639 RepID=A0A445MBT2_ENSVE|nr:hypothetical protein BHM03_00006749 [Ensete ventricosum]
MPCPTWFVCSPGQVIASPRGVETSLIEVTSSPHKPRRDAGERSLLFSQASLLSFWTFSFSVTKIFGPPWFFHSQVGIVSSPSFTTSGISSHFSSLVPPPWAEECRPSCSSGDQSEPPSLSSGVMTRADVKALQALEVMKSSHDFDSTVEDIPLEEATRKAPESSGKRPTEASSSQRKKIKVFGRHKSHREGEKLSRHAAEGKRPAALVERTPAPRTRSKSVKELCNTCLGADGQHFYVIRVSNQPKSAPDAPFEVDLTPWTHGMPVWQDDEASVKYVWVTQIPKLATDLYTLLFEVLMDRAAKTMVLNQHYYVALIDRVHDAGRVITSLDDKVNILGKDVQRLKESGDLDAVATVKKQASEAQSLLDRLRTESEEAIRQHESLEKELSEIWERLSVSQGQLSEARRQLSDS